MSKMRFYILFFIFSSFFAKFGSIYAMEKVVEGVKGVEKEEVLFEGESRELNGRDLLVVDPEKKFKPMIVSNLKTKLTCKDPKKRLFMVVQEVKQNTEIQDPIEKMVKDKESNTECNLALEAFGKDDLGILEHELVELKPSKEVKKTEQDLMVEWLANHLKSNKILSELGEKDNSLEKDSEKEGAKEKEKVKDKENKNGKGKNKIQENKVELGFLEFCKRVIEAEPFVKELVKKEIENKKSVSKSLVGDLISGAVGVVENLGDLPKEGSYVGGSNGSDLISRVCNFALMDNQKQKENASKLESEKKNTEIRNKCLSIGTVVVSFVSLLTGASSVIKMFGLDGVVKDLIIGIANSTAS